MSWMFCGAKVFNNGGKSFEFKTATSKDCQVNWMFTGAKSFTVDIKQWDVSNVVEH